MSDREGVKPTACPGCGTMLDAATCMTGDTRPKDGDYTICSHCYKILRIVQGGAVTAPADGEIEALPEKNRVKLLGVLSIVCAARSKSTAGTRS